MEHTVFPTYKRFTEIIFVKNKNFLYDGSSREGLDGRK